MSVESELRMARGEIDGWKCRWGACELPLDPVKNPLEMAHLAGKGMGGRKSANEIDNVVMTCRFHHRILDGDLSADRKFETRRLYAAYVEATEPADPPPAMSDPCGDPHDWLPFRWIECPKCGWVDPRPFDQRHPTR